MLVDGNDGPLDREMNAKDERVAGVGLASCARPDRGRVSLACRGAGAARMGCSVLRLRARR